MRFHWASKDGGKDSNAWIWGVESKRFGSVLLLKFSGRSREVFHTHAFNAVSWVLRGRLDESTVMGANWGYNKVYRPSLRPIWTPRTQMHQVSTDGPAWAITLRGPWSNFWFERSEDQRTTVMLTHGRKEVQ